MIKLAFHVNVKQKHCTQVEVESKLVLSTKLTAGKFA